MLGLGMGKRAVVAATALLALAATDAGAQKLPGKVSFTVLIEGEKVGHTDITIEETANRLILTSIMKLERANLTQTGSARTVADKQTYQVLKFDCEQERNGIKYGADLNYDADRIYGHTIDQNETFGASRTPQHKTTIFLADFLFEHQILLGRLHTSRYEDRVPHRYGLIFPLNLSQANVAITTASEAFLESDIKEAAVVKLHVAIDGSEPFVSFWDQGRGLPLYIAFPATNTEVFLDEFFGDTPISRFREKDRN